MAQAPHLSISDPRFNVREIVKQMILLEQHLLETAKYCPDCITKHLLTIEALAEEAQCLDTEGLVCDYMERLSVITKGWSAGFAAGAPPKVLGQQVRQVRKKMAPWAMEVGAGNDLGGLAEDHNHFGGMVGGASNLPTWAIALGAVGALFWWTEKRK